MPILQNRGSYLFVEGLEPYSKAGIFRSIQEINDACKLNKLVKVLIDLRAVKDYISILDRFEIGKEIAKVIGSKIKVAVIADFNLINYLTENSAVNRGAKLRVFVDSLKAIEWLDVNP